MTIPSTFLPRAEDPEIGSRSKPRAASRLPATELAGADATTSWCWWFCALQVAEKRLNALGLRRKVVPGRVCTPPVSPCVCAPRVSAAQIDGSATVSASP
eukprot:5623534-Prorocentrum_lima.AAC.1